MYKTSVLMNVIQICPQVSVFCNNSNVLHHYLFFQNLKHGRGRNLNLASNQLLVDLWTTSVSGSQLRLTKKIGVCKVFATDNRLTDVLVVLVQQTRGRCPRRKNQQDIIIEGSSAKPPVFKPTAHACLLWLPPMLVFTCVWLGDLPSWGYHQ